jgi:hypothetical protein
VKKDSTVRFQAEIARRDYALVELLMRDLDVSTNGEFFSHILSIAGWAVSERRCGRKLTSMSFRGQPVRELVSPLLERAAPQPELPHFDLEWTEEEIGSIEKLATRPPASPNQKLRDLMKVKPHSSVA